MIVWGGFDIFTDEALNSGGRYSPVTDTWDDTTTAGGAPGPRFWGHVQVWTGSKMLVWGGWDGIGSYYDTGGIYDPPTDSWEDMTTSSATPDPRQFATGVWTGNEMIVWGGENDTVLFDSGASFSLPSLPDLSIDSVRLAQVVWDPNFNSLGLGSVDLVLNKPAVAEVLVAIEPVASLDDNVQVAIALYQDGVLLSQDSFKAGALEDGPAYLYFTPTREGSRTLTVLLDSAVTEADPDNNTKEVDIDVWNTRGLEVVYFTLPECATSSCYGPLDSSEMDSFTSDASDTKHHGGLLIQATYPTSRYVSPPLQYSIFGSDTRCLGVMWDLAQVGLAAFLTGADRGLGLVPQRYFEDWHNTGSLLCSFDNTPGLAAPWLVKNAALVMVGWPASVAHEIGHTYGLSSGFQKEEYCCYAHPSLCDCRSGCDVHPECSDIPGLGGQLSDGYWVDGQLPVDGVLCFMSGDPGRPVLEPGEEPVRWIDREHYEQLFAEFTAPIPDPPVLAITYLASQDGGVVLGQWAFKGEGRLETYQPGRDAIRVLDASGSVLHEVAFAVDFKVIVEPHGQLPAEAVPVLRRVPFDEAAALVEIVREGKVVERVDAVSKLLHDAVDGIPSSGFMRNGIQRASALHNKVSAMENMLSAGNAKGALQKLTHDVRPTVQAWLRDGYAKSSPLQLEKAEVLDLIDALAIRLWNMR